MRSGCADIAQWVRTVTQRCAAIAQWLRSHCAVVAHHNCFITQCYAVCAQSLRSGCAAIAQRVRSHCAAGAQTVRSGCAALRNFITQRYAVGAQPLRSETRVRNGCVIVITQPLRSHYARGNLLMKWIRSEHRLANAREDLARLWKERISKDLASRNGAAAAGLSDPADNIPVEGGRRLMMIALCQPSGCPRPDAGTGACPAVHQCFRHLPGCSCGS